MVGGLALSLGAFAETPSFVLELAEGGFQPQTIEIPAQQKVKLTVTNKLDGKKMEFESYSLNREEIIKAGQSTEVFIGPLTAGEYEFFDEFNDEYKGKIIVK